MIKILLFFILILSSCSQAIVKEEPPLIPPSEKSILALGDSLTAGYGLPIVHSYPNQLEVKLKEMGYEYRVQNAGISGDTTAGLLSRLDWLLEWEEYDLIILCIGANDAFQWKSPEDIENNIRSIITKIRNKNIPLLLAGMKAPLNLGRSYGERYEAIFPRLSKEFDLPFMPFFLEWVALKWSLNLDDRIHPNKEWYFLIVQNLIEILENEDLLSEK
jgi:acyl-CoA thioesterase I